MYRALLFLVFGVLSSSALFAQRTIVGKVTDCKGELLTGAIIMIRGTQIGTSADENGFYRIELPKALDTRKQALVFEYYGTKTQEVFIKGRDTIDVQLKNQEKPKDVEIVQHHSIHSRRKYPLEILMLKRTIVGKVTDANGEPLAGATILIKGTDVATVADENGFYNIELPIESDTSLQALVFEVQGVEPKTVSIGKEDTINVILEEPGSIIECGSSERYK